MLAKGSLYNNLDKKVLLWHREATLFFKSEGYIRFTQHFFFFKGL